MSTIDYDKFGHCVNCHRDLRVEKAIEGKIELTWHADKQSLEFLLNDGSRMRVSICRQCKGKVGEDNFEYIMNCVVKGWDMETDSLVKSQDAELWTDDRKKNYMNRQKSLRIVATSEGKDRGFLKDRLKEYKLKEKIRKKVKA